MVQDVFSLHRIAGGDEVTLPFSIKDYQRYVFGDDRLAHEFGTGLAKAYIAHGPGTGAIQAAPTIATTTPTTTRNHSEDVVVAVLSGQIPTATHCLRNHFVAYLNRHLVSSDAQPAVKIELHGPGDDPEGRSGSLPHGSIVSHVDREKLGNRTILIVGDLRTSPALEDRTARSLQELKITNPLVFVYLAALDDTANVADLSPILSFIVNPPLKDVEAISQNRQFVMNESFVQFILGRGYVEFCQFVRRQDDSFIRQLLDYAISGNHYKNEIYEDNFDFLSWEMEARESM